MGDAVMLKRLFDFVLAGAGLIAVAPLMAGIAAAVKLGSRGPVFFRQERLGLYGRPFRIYKFRSMICDAERRGNKFTVSGDDRVTPVGRFLRRHKLDELPQLINVVRGEMSLVGPRPEVPEYAERFPVEFARILRVKPGITHPTTLRFRDEEKLLAAAEDPRAAYLEQVMPAKMHLYAENLSSESLRSDVATIVQTILKVGETMSADDLAAFRTQPRLDRGRVAVLPSLAQAEMPSLPARETVA